MENLYQIDGKAIFPVLDYLMEPTGEFVSFDAAHVDQESGLGDMSHKIVRTKEEYEEEQANG